MSVKSGGGSRQHHYTTKSITFRMYQMARSPVTEECRGRGERRVPEGKGNFPRGAS